MTVRGAREPYGGQQMTVSFVEEIAEWVPALLHAKRITWRRYGLNGERCRPMYHRFEVKGGETVFDVMKDTLTQRNPLLDALTKRGR